LHVARHRLTLGDLVSCIPAAMIEEYFPMRGAMLILAAWTLVAGCGSPSEPIDVAQLRRDVLETERAFAATMAARDHAAFATYLGDDAIFFADDVPLRGKQAITAAWQTYFAGAEAPFAWEPTQVEVLDSGDLALTTGPVYDPRGGRIATFSSIWRRHPNGSWRIIFDKGNAACPSP
jgi:ketosteroid isomerase-like protein